MPYPQEAEPWTPFEEVHPPVASDYQTIDGKEELTLDYTNRKLAYENDERIKISNTKLEAGKIRAALKASNPVDWFYSSQTTIAECNKEVVEAVFAKWKKDQESATTRVYRIVLKAVRDGFFPTERKLEEGWSHWESLVRIEASIEPISKTRKNQVSLQSSLSRRYRRLTTAQGNDFKAAMHKMRQRMVKCLDEFPLLVKAKQEGGMYKPSQATYEALVTLGQAEAERLAKNFPMVAPEDVKMFPDGYKYTPKTTAGDEEDTTSLMRRLRARLEQNASMFSETNAFGPALRFAMDNYLVEAPPGDGLPVYYGMGNDFFVAVGQRTAHTIFPDEYLNERLLEIRRESADQSDQTGFHLGYGPNPSQPTGEGDGHSGKAGEDKSESAADQGQRSGKGKEKVVDGKEEDGMEVEEDEDEGDAEMVGSEDEFLT